ncbi:uncharacterized protein LOC108665208 [Hyalella azteca]|uniref:Uncharacterized protein LOC108665208 n=1 Tax=Hyalella azteca TaxID=294128 RepID=A0A8B7N1K1_HYAAZ|nr:uncharacterized protein LOC108665208 [Hyalella azteca]
MFRLTLAACLLAVSLAAVANPKTPNQIIDAVIERANAKIKALGWDVMKNIQNGGTQFNLQVSDSQSGSSTAKKTFNITNADMTGLGSLHRSKSGQFLNSNTVLKGSLRLTNARAKADYKLVFPGSGSAAPASTSTGSVTEKADKLFVDFEFNLDANKVPQSIKSWTVRSGRDGLEASSGLPTDGSGNIDVAGIRNSLLQVMKNTLNTNIKVQVNSAIQDWKTQASG